jgi:hypothetical protein
MNLQVIAGSDDDILWMSGALPGAVHDLTVTWGILGEVATSGLVVLGNKGYLDEAAFASPSRTGQTRFTEGR